MLRCRPRVDKPRAANQKPLKKSLWQPQRVPEVQFLISFFMIALYFPPTILVLFFDMQSVIFDNITQILCKCSCFCIKCCYKVIAHSRALQKHVAFIVPNDTNWSFQVQLNFPCASFSSCYASKKFSEKKTSLAIRTPTLGKFSTFS